MSNEQSDSQIQRITFLYHALGFTSQSIANLVSNWDWPADDFVFEYSKQIPHYLRFDQVIPDLLLIRGNNIPSETFHIFRDYLRFGFISVQMSFLDACCPDVNILSQIYSQVMQIEDCFNIENINNFKSNIKIERVLLSLKHKDIPSLNIAFSAYRNDLSEIDKKLYYQIENLLQIFSTMSDCEESFSLLIDKLLAKSRLTRNIIMRNMLKVFLKSNEDRLYNAFHCYFDITGNSILSMNEAFRKQALICLYDPMNISGQLDYTSHPDNLIAKMKAKILHMKETTSSRNLSNDNENISNFHSDEICKYISDNFLLSHRILPTRTIEEANKNISKFTPRDYNYLDDSYSPEADQESSGEGFIQLILSLTATPDDALSLIRLIISGKHPSIRY